MKIRFYISVLALASLTVVGVQASAPKVYVNPSVFEKEIYQLDELIKRGPINTADQKKWDEWLTKHKSYSPTRIDNMREKFNRVTRTPAATPAAAAPAAPAAPASVATAGQERKRAAEATFPDRLARLEVEADAEAEGFINRIDNEKIPLAATLKALVDRLIEIQKQPAQPGEALYTKAYTMIVLLDVIGEVKIAGEIGKYNNLEKIYDELAPSATQLKVTIKALKRKYTAFDTNMNNELNQLWAQASALTVRLQEFVAQYNKELAEPELQTGSF